MVTLIIIVLLILLMDGENGRGIRSEDEAIEEWIYLMEEEEEF